VSLYADSNNEVFRGTQLAKDRELSREREERINTQFNKLSSDMNATKWAIYGMGIATILGIAALVVTILVK